VAVHNDDSDDVLTPALALCHCNIL